MCGGARDEIGVASLRMILPRHGGSKEIGKGLWQAILRQLGIKE